MAPEGFSYGPSVLEVLPNVSTADGGATGTIYGYGFGPTSATTLPAGLQVSVGGTPATITAFSGLSQVNGFSPLQSVQFTFPAASAGATADITLASASGATTAKAAIQYLPAIQQYPLAAANLMQGIYDPKRDLYYFTDQTKIQVFSTAQSAWLTPFSIPKAGRLWGIALSPDGSTLAVTDAAQNVVDVLSPDNPSAVSVFALPNTGSDYGAVPTGLAISDAGMVYYASYDSEGSGANAFHKLNTSTGAVFDYPNLRNGESRVLLSSDNSRVFTNLGGSEVLTIDTATDTEYSNLFNDIFSTSTQEAGHQDLTLSSNGTRLAAGGYLMDTNLNLESETAWNELEALNEEAVYGQKLSPDGTLLFAPLTNAINVFDGRTGVFRARVALPFALSTNDDALVSNGKDDVLVAITGENGNGIAVIDLNSLPEPLPLPYSTLASDSIRIKRQTSAMGGVKRTDLHRHLPHRTRHFSITPRRP